MAGARARRRPNSTTAPNAANVYPALSSLCAQTHGERCRMAHALNGNCARFVYVGLAAILLTTMNAALPKAEDTGHHQFHDSHYRHWKQPGTDISCCADQDCAPVAAEFRQGRWFALRQAEWFAPPDELGPGDWLPLRQSEWVPVPEERIIRVPNPSVESAHLCYSRGMVICFVPPNTGG